MLARRLAELTRLPLYQLDMMQLKAGWRCFAKGVFESAYRSAVLGRVDR